MPAVGPAGTVKKPYPLRNNGSQLRAVVMEISPDGIGKVNGGRTGQWRVGPAVQRRGNRPAHILLQKAIDLLYQLPDKIPGGLLGFLGDLILEHQQRGCQIQIRFQSLQQLRFQQKLLQSLARDSVVLYNGHNLRIKEAAQIPQPFGNVRGGRPVSASLPRCLEALLRSAVDGSQRTVDQQLLLGQRGGSHLRKVRLALRAQNQAPAGLSFLLCHGTPPQISSKSKSSRLFRDSCSLCDSVPIKTSAACT